MGHRALGSSIHAWAKLRVAPGEPWMDAFYPAAAAAAPRLGAVGFVTVVWSLARLGQRPDPDWLRQLLEDACGGGGDSSGGSGGGAGGALEGFTPQRLAMTVCAFARLGWTPGPEWLSQLGAAAALAGSGSGPGGAQGLDHFHIEWAWRELNDQYAQRMRERQQRGPEEEEQEEGGGADPLKLPAAAASAAAAERGSGDTRSARSES
ncbi:hypothetical protein MNEG_14562 [Monoraphidium neglectum]|uniref:Uncharacterized protein n=1 Tax=Monoraphidium neglectum TaxID=145388 RepID=A0A0D2KBZ4_9CHLO|nr:hypothetical protein MNEG_14562 [Monoraphidium neglectum]KIY93398.1 hypothetical protein MNEG_14562 [Monoraphidium neglectum]|eukprot:XP_013892418.1 hypothetical protein MNEG_14562 [Monoraphidium neglectum]